MDPFASFNTDPNQAPLPDPFQSFDAAPLIINSVPETPPETVPEVIATSPPPASPKPLEPPIKDPISANEENTFLNAGDDKEDHDLTTKITDPPTLEKAKMSTKAGLSTSLMEGISAKLQSCDKGDTSVFSNFKKYTMIGTQRGCIYVFDLTEELIQLLTPPDTDPVTSLAYCETYELLVSSNQRGKITIWDITKGKVVKEISDIHSFSVTSLSFINQNPMLLLSVDISGVTYVTEIQKRMWIVSITSTKFPTISDGIGICSTLSLPTETTLVAQNSMSNTILYTSTNIQRRSKTTLWAKPADINQSAIPCLAWSFGIIQGTRDPVPLLARGWDRHLEFYCADGPIDRWLSIFDQLTNATILCLSWLEAQKTVFLDQEGQLSIFDLSYLNIIETVDLTAINPISIPVSNQMLYGSTPVSYHLSFYGKEGKVYMLEPKILYCGSIKTVTERVEEQIQEGNYVNGIAIYTSYYETTIRDEYSTQAKLLQQKIVNLLIEYIECAFGINKLYNTNNIHIDDNLDNVVNTCYCVCSQINCVNELYNKLYPLFYSTKQYHTFFKYLLNGLKSQTITYLPNEMLIKFIQYMIAMDRQNELENTIIKMDMTKLKIDELINICSSFHLYHAVLYIFNRQLKKFFPPIILLLNNYEVTHRDDIAKILFDYLFLLFDGKCYPDGNVDQQLLPCLIAEITGFICNKRKIDNTLYPALHLLINYSLTDTLTVISTVFNDPNKYGNITQYPNKTPLHFFCPSQQDIFESLCSEILDKSEESIENKSKVVNFLGLTIASGEIDISTKYFTLILECIFYKVDSYPTNEKQEKENILLTLIRQWSINDYDIEHIIEIANTSSLSPVTALLHRKTGDITQGLLSYLNNNDMEMKKQVFGFIMSEVNESNEQFRDKMLGILKNYMTQLLELDMYQSTMLLLQLIPHEIENILEKLGNGEEQCKLLNYLVGDGDNEDQKKRLTNLKDSTHFQISQEMEYNYIELLCKYDQSKIPIYLKEHHTYDTDKVMDLCKEYKLQKCVIYLMMQKAQYIEAFELLKQELMDVINELTKELNNENIDLDHSNNITSLESGVDSAVDVLSLYNEDGNKSKNDSSEYWYSLLDLLDKNRENIIKGIKNKEILTQFNNILINVIGKILTSMRKYVLIKDIMDYILRRHGKDNLGPFRSIVSEIMEGNSNDIRIVGVAKSIIEKDAFKTSSNIFHEIMPFRPISQICIICGKAMNYDPNLPFDIKLYNCGHMCHNSCTNCKCCILCCKESESENYRPFSVINEAVSEEQKKIELLEEELEKKYKLPKCYKLVNLDNEFDKLDEDLNEYTFNDEDVFELTAPLLPPEEKRRLTMMVQQITQPLNQTIQFADSPL